MYEDILANVGMWAWVHGIEAFARHFHYFYARNGGPENPIGHGSRMCDVTTSYGSVCGSMFGGPKRYNMLRMSPEVSIPM